MWIFSLVLLLLGMTAEESEREYQQRVVEEQEEARVCETSPACKGEKIAAVACENLATRAAAKHEIACRRAVGDAKVTGKTRKQVHDVELAACAADRSLFADMETFEELEDLVQDLTMTIATQQNLYRETTGKRFRLSLCK